MEKKKRKSVFDEDLDGEYIGNIFGWKTSIIGLVVIVSFIVLYMILEKRNKSMNQPIDEQMQITEDSISNIDKKDTLEIK